MNMDRDPNVYDRETPVDNRDRSGSNFLAYLIGGLVVAIGLLAFLFYQGGGRDVSTTGSTVPHAERSTAVPDSGSAPAPAAPEAPARPATQQ